MTINPCVWVETHDKLTMYYHACYETYYAKVLLLINASFALSRNCSYNIVEHHKATARP